MMLNFLYLIVVVSRKEFGIIIGIEMCVNDASVCVQKLEKNIEVRKE